MFSIKDTLRKTIVTTSALAVFATSFFTGCSQQPTVSSSELYPTTSEATTDTLTDDINPGINDETHDANTFSIKYKYWYDNPDVKETQDKALAEADPGGDNPNGETFLGLPLYTSPEGNQYIISGRTVVYVNDGKITKTELDLLRTATGDKIYVMSEGIDKIAESVSDFFSRIDKTQATTIDERKQDVATPEISAEQELEIYVNNLKSEFKTSNGLIPISAIFQTSRSLGDVDMTTPGKVTVSMNTAAGLVDVIFTLDNEAGTAKVTYSTGLKGTEISQDTDYVNTGATLQLTPELIEDLLGYDVETYDDFINIVTDNHDLFSSDNIVDKYDADKVTKGIKLSTDDVDPANPIPVSKPEPKSEETKPVEDTKPVATKKSSNGKYDMTDADIENPDGTFTENLNQNPIPPSCVQDRMYDGIENIYESKSNPSAIPYSQITIENAAEAFPYTGFIGKDPGYIMIRPGDSKSTIANKIFCNYWGADSSTFFNNSQLDMMEAPEIVYKSEAEYKQALADYKAEQQRMHEADKRADAYDPTKGDRIGDDLKNLSTEELNDLLWG